MNIKRKGIVLAGGQGTRLSPITKVLSKQLLPIYDKPMIYYPISTLMIAGIREVLIISTPEDIPKFQDLLGNGDQWGMNFQFAIQEKPEGLAQAFIIGREFLDGRESVLILGDNIFYGDGLTKLMSDANKQKDGATIFACRVSDPKRFGIVDFDSNNSVISIHEKPSIPRSNYAVTGLYFYDRQVCDIAMSLKPSSRGELEITDINKFYLEQGSLKAEIMSRGFAWLDTGTFESLLDASAFISTLQKRQGLQVSCPEEIAYYNGWISDEQLLRLAYPLKKSSYGQYLQGLVNKNR